MKDTAYALMTLLTACLVGLGTDSFSLGAATFTAMLALDILFDKATDRIIKNIK